MSFEMPHTQAEDLLIWPFVTLGPCGYPDRSINTLYNQGVLSPPHKFVSSQRQKYKVIHMKHLKTLNRLTELKSLRLEPESLRFCQAIWVIIMK